jgi:ribonuclease BN (tRNA processing enzyme)
MNGNFNIPVWVNLGSHVHTGHFAGLCERVNVQTAQGGKTNLFCLGCFWAISACFGSVSSEYMNIYEGYRNVTSVFAL